MAYQKEKFTSFLEQELSQFFSREAGVFLPEGAFVSVSRTEINESGEIATVYVLIFPKDITESALRDLKKLENQARRHLAERLKRRQIPKIRIKLDTGEDKKIRLEKLLDIVEDE